MTTDLHPTINAYFALIDTPDNAGIADLFTPDATVTDNGHTYRGREEILTWLAGPASQYATTTTPLHSTRTQHTTAVTVRVDGDFPGGTVNLQQTFNIDASDL